LALRQEPFGGSAAVAADGVAHTELDKLMSRPPERCCAALDAAVDAVRGR
jgi:hypothetical protein